MCCHALLTPYGILLLTGLEISMVAIMIWLLQLLEILQFPETAGYVPRLYIMNMKAYRVVPICITTWVAWCALMTSMLMNFLKARSC